MFKIILLAILGVTIAVSLCGIIAVMEDEKDYYGHRTNLVKYIDVCLAATFAFACVAIFGPNSLSPFMNFEKEDVGRIEFNERDTSEEQSVLQEEPITKEPPKFPTENEIKAAVSTYFDTADAILINRAIDDDVEIIMQVRIRVTNILDVYVVVDAELEATAHLTYSDHDSCKWECIMADWMNKDKVLVVSEG